MTNGLPAALVQSLKGIRGFDEQSFIAVHENGERVSSIRTNPLKSVASPFTGSERIPWSTNGYYLPERPSFTLDPFLHAGAYYVQEASSMFLEQCLKQTVDIDRSLRILDLCAAPGGKSTLIQSLISGDSLLVSNEVIKSRVNVLIENLSKWGYVNQIVTNNDPADFERMENYFDVIVADAPCSGSGLFRRDPSAIAEWSSDAVEMCSLRQQRILSDVLPALKRDGVLIYSTCSYSKEEDENICDWLLENFDLDTLPLNVPPEWNIVETNSYKNAKGYRFFPDRLKGEGFFVACFRKNNGDSSFERRTKKSKHIKLSSGETAIVAPWLNSEIPVHLYHLGDEIFAFPEGMGQDLSDIGANLYIRKAGIPVGRLLKDELVPAHELALSNIVNKDLLSISLKKNEALQYLRKEEVAASVSAKGWALVQYERQNLGWVKLLHNRINNYYPKEWRILKSGNN